MKTVVLIAMLSFGSYFAIAQDIHYTNVPSVVRNAFEQKYPKAMGVEWEMEGDLYNVEFHVMFREHEAWFDSTGKLVKMVKDIDFGDLPTEVKASLKQNFPGYRVDDIDRIDSNGTFTYKFDLEKGPEERKVILDTQGNILQNIMD